MFRSVYFILFGCVLVIALGQVLFKVAATGLRFDASLSALSNIQNNAQSLGLICLALVLYSMSTFAWVMVLRSVPLSIAFMFNAISFILVPVIGFSAFGESVPRFFWAGALLIFVGIALIVLPNGGLD